MSIIKYIEGRFNVGQALKDGWNLEWEGEESLIGIRLQDRKKPKHKVTINKVEWIIGTMTISFIEGGWLCLDHAINQFKPINPNDINVAHIKE